MDNDLITDFSDRGRLTQKGIRSCTTLEIRDRGCLACLEAAATTMPVRAGTQLL